MQNKGITYLLISILILAVIFQFIRSDGIIQLAKNFNAKGNIEEPINLIKTDELTKERFLILYDHEEEGSLMIKDHVNRVLNYMKKEVLIQEVQENLEDLDYDCIIFTFEALDKIQHISNLIEYVNDGGSIIFMERPVTDMTFNEVATGLGITNHTGLIVTKGIKINSNILIGAKGFKTNDKFIENSSLNVQLSDNAIIHLTSYEDLPLLWETDYGKGKVVVFNGTVTNDKISTGLIAGIISLSKSNFIYPIINSKQIHIDDFPAPIPNAMNETIYNEYNKTTPEFYREIWWSDMLRAAKQYDVKYTGFMIETYHDQVEGPFTKEGAISKEELLLYGHELLKSGGEIGIHGYNHQSLALEGFIKQDLGYNPWISTEDMVNAVKEVNDYGHSVFPDYQFKAYVPPSNILSPEGREAVKVGMPDLSIISSVYLPNLYGDIYDQEFEINKDGIIEFPRLTYGYHNSDEAMWMIYNGVNLFGIVSHFVHPDDVLDDYRSKGLGWSNLYKKFSAMLKEIHHNYWWLNAQTISEGGASLVRYIEADPYIKYEGKEIRIVCDNYRSDLYFILRSDDSIKSYKDCKVYNIDENIYLIKIENNSSVIEVDSEGL